MWTLIELTQLPADELQARTRVARINLATAEWNLAVCLQAVERTGLFRTMGYATMTHYTAEHLGLDGHKTSELLRAARALETLPAIREAFRTGLLCWSKIREMTRVVVPETEEEWLEYALHHTSDEVQKQVSMTPRQWKDGVLAAARLQSQLTLNLDEVEESAPPRQPVERVPGDTPSATRSPSPVDAPIVEPDTAPPRSGTPGIPARNNAPRTPEPLPDTESDAAGERSCKPPGAASHPPPVPSKVPAPRRVRVVLDFTTEEYVEFERTEVCLRSILRKRARREEVVLEMARRSMSGTTAATRLRYQIVVHADSGLENAWCQTDRGVLPVTPEQLERELAEAHVTVLTEADPGSSAVPGEKSKGVQRSTMRLLMARSGGRCEVCRCSGPLHVHHKKPRSRGGGHELKNLELRCDACHHFGHDADYRNDPTWHSARARRRKKRPGQMARDG